MLAGQKRQHIITGDTTGDSGDDNALLVQYYSSRASQPEEGATASEGPTQL